MSTLTFVPERLEAELRTALKETEEWCDAALGDTTINRSFSDEDLPDQTVTPETELVVSLVRSEPARTTVGAFIGMCQELQAPEFEFDGLIYHCRKRTIVAVEPSDAKAHYVVASLGEGGTPHFSVSAKHNGTDIRIGLTAGSLAFALGVVKEELFWDKYYPPYDGQTHFVDIVHADGLARNDAFDVIHAYLFELGSTLGLGLSFSPRADDGDAVEDNEDESPTPDAGQRFRPLLLGTGMGPLLREYYAAMSTTNSENAVLGFAKCIEYTAASVVRQRQYEDVRRRLMSPEAIDPTAPFIDGLLALVEEHRVFMKDSEALRLAIERCCDAQLLAPVAPLFVKRLRELPETAKAADRKAALNDFAACLSSTRNRIAHAKANYDLSGQECPENDMLDLAQCAKLAAEQCIRWYGDLNPTLRRR
jgi:hypothetical protein